MHRANASIAVVFAVLGRALAGARAAAVTLMQAVAAAWARELLTCSSALTRARLLFPPVGSGKFGTP